MRKGLYILIVALLGAWVQTSWAAGYSFRYRDNNGAIHIGYSVPPQFVKNGYDVLNEKGRVVDTVLPKEALDANAAKLLEKAEARRKFEVQQAKDEALLRFYSSPEDVERVRARRLGELDNFIAIQRANILSYRSRIANLQHQAADLERGGRKVPEDIMETLATLEENVLEAEQTIKERQEQKEAITLAFEADIKRLNELLNKGGQ